MERSHIQGVGEFYSYYPKLVVIVSAHHDGKDNAMTAAWHSPISFSPPLYGVFLSPKRFTHQLIVASREFCLNFLPLDRAELAARIGGTKGQEVDKFSLLNIRKEKAVKVKAPLLGDAYVSYECRLKEYHSYGDHDLFVGEILVTHFVKDLFLPKGIIDVRKASPALYIGADNYLSVASDSLRIIERQPKVES